MCARLHTRMPFVEVESTWPKPKPIHWTHARLSTMRCPGWHWVGKQDGILIEELTPARTGHDSSCWGYFRQFTLTELIYADDICIKKLAP